MFEEQLVQIMNRSKFLIEGIDLVEYFTRNCNYFQYSNSELTDRVQKDISCLNALKERFKLELNKCRTALIDAVEEQLRKEQNNVSQDDRGI